MSEREKVEKSKASEGDFLDKYERLKKEFSKLEKEEKQLKDYLNVNVFDYAQNKQQIEDIFSINDPSISFLDYEENTYKPNPNIPVIEINNLTKTYASRKFPSLLNLSLRIYLGDTHIVVGPSGSGKTTLFNCLKGVEDYEGEILIEGTELSSHPNFYNDKFISFVPYEFSWDSYATVENVMFERFQELNMTEIEMQNYIRSSLENLNISYLRNFYIIDLTLLEKRKLQIAIALISDPHVMVFDEIFSGLQQNECFELLLIFSKLKQQARSIVVFSYSFNDFMRFSNSVTILAEGKVYYSGPITGFLYSKVLNYSISTDDTTKTIEILSKTEGCNFIYKKDIGLILANFDGKLSLFKFQQSCIEQGVIIHELKLLETRVEDLFVLLKYSGNKDAVKDINFRNFFSP